MPECAPRYGCVVLKTVRPPPFTVNTLKGRVVKETATCEHLLTTAQRLLLLALSPAHFPSPVSCGQPSCGARAWCSWAALATVQGSRRPAAHGLSVVCEVTSPVCVHQTNLHTVFRCRCGPVTYTAQAILWHPHGTATQVHATTTAPGICEGLAPYTGGMTWLYY